MDKELEAVSKEMYQEPQVARTIHKYTLLGTRYYIDDYNNINDIDRPKIYTYVKLQPAS